MVYGRRVAGRELTLEASGALLDASLVMRDRETDSWWSLMSSSAIGGELEGTRLPELPAGEKTSWKEWRARHPDTLVLSVGGREHVSENAYDTYFASERTFRGITVKDRRLPAREPVFTFRLGGRPYAAAHSAFEGGKLFEIDGARILLYRPSGASPFESTKAVLVEGAADGGPEDPLRLLARAERGDLERLPGFDTFWYTWVAVNPETRLLE